MKLAKWESQVAQTISSIEPHIVLNLRTYKTAKDVWAYLKYIYHQDNSAVRFRLESEIAQYTQRDKSTVY